MDSEKVTIILPLSMEIWAANGIFTGEDESTDLCLCGPTVRQRWTQSSHEWTTEWTARAWLLCLQEVLLPELGNLGHLERGMGYLANLWRPGLDPI